MTFQQVAEALPYITSVTGCRVERDPISPKVWLGVEDPALRVAFTHIAAEAGVELVTEVGTATYRVASDLGQLSQPSQKAVNILVVPPTPVRSRIAVGALMAGMIRSAVSTKEPYDLLIVLRNSHLQVGIVSGSIIHATRQLATLTLRQHRLLHRISGEVLSKDRELAKSLEVSTATLKREIRHLYDAFDVDGRHMLASRARTVGYDPQLSDVELRLAASITCSCGQDEVELVKAADSV